MFMTVVACGAGVGVDLATVLPLVLPALLAPVLLAAARRLR